MTKKEFEWLNAGDYFLYKNKIVKLDNKGMYTLFFEEPVAGRRDMCYWYPTVQAIPLSGQKDAAQEYKMQRLGQW